LFLFTVITDAAFSAPVFIRNNYRVWNRRMELFRRCTRLRCKHAYSSYCVRRVWSINRPVQHEHVVTHMYEHIEASHRNLNRSLTETFTSSHALSDASYFRKYDFYYKRYSQIFKSCNQSFQNFT